MATSKRAPEAETRRCEAPDCVVDFVPQRSTARYHSTTCRSRAARARKAAEHHAAEESKTDTTAEHDLVKAVRLELHSANATMTVAGQLALQLARRIADPEAAGISTLSKELRALLVEAGVKQPAPAGADDPKPAEEPEDDEVTRARTRRKEARKAAGLA